MFKPLEPHFPDDDAAGDPDDDDRPRPPGWGRVEVFP